LPPELKFVICHSLESGHTIIDELDEVPPDGTFQTPLSDKPFRIEDAQEHRLLIAYRDQETTIPLKREQFETLYQRISESHNPSILIASLLMPNPTPPSSRSIHASRSTNGRVC